MSIQAKYKKLEGYAEGEAWEKEILDAAIDLAVEAHRGACRRYCQAHSQCDQLQELQALRR